MYPVHNLCPKCFLSSTAEIDHQPMEYPNYDKAVFGLNFFIHSTESNVNSSPPGCLRGSFRQTVPANRPLFFFVHPDLQEHIPSFFFVLQSIPPKHPHPPHPTPGVSDRQADRQASFGQSTYKGTKNSFSSLDRAYNTHPNDKLGPSVPALDSIRSERDVQESGTKLTKRTKNIRVTYYSAPT